jgi:nicotinamidase-related amidase
MDLQRTALILIGYQNDYFAQDGILRGVIEEADRTHSILENTLALVDALKDTPVTMIETPIIFTEDYGELVNPVGILKTIVDVQAFKQGTPGAETVEHLAPYADRILTVPGKRGLNAFSNTELNNVLRQNNIEHVILCGAVTSICIDSTGRAAHERDYRVTVVADGTASRTPFEQSFYCESVFPLYAEVCTFKDLLNQLEPHQ